MPLISSFYGILIYLYKELGDHHNSPHIHIKYNEYEASMLMDGTIIGGNLPIKQLKLVQAWLEIHHDELLATWYSYNNDGEILKIKGLE